MTENQNQNNPLKNSEEHEKLIQEYEAKIAQEKAAKEKWKNAYLKSEQGRLEINQAKERTEEERDDWKRQAYQARKIELETKETKQKNDTLTLFTQKFQAKMEGAK